MAKLPKRVNRGADAVNFNQTTMAQQSAANLDPLFGAIATGRQSSRYRKRCGAPPAKRPCARGAATRFPAYFGMHHFGEI